jgi:hypothetical protein
VTMGKGMTSAAKTLGTIRSMMGPAGVAAAVSAPRPTISPVKVLLCLSV